MSLWVIEVRSRPFLHDLGRWMEAARHGGSERTTSSERKGCVRGASSFSLFFFFSRSNQKLCLSGKGAKGTRTELSGRLAAPLPRHSRSSHGISSENVHQQCSSTAWLAGVLGPKLKKGEQEQTMGHIVHGSEARKAGEKRGEGDLAVVGGGGCRCHSHCVVASLLALRGCTQPVY